MNSKYIDFIGYVKKTYKKDFGVNLVFPKFNEMKKYHTETLMRIGIESKFFDIEDDIDSLVNITHLHFLSFNFLIKPIDELYKCFKSNADSIVYNGNDSIEKNYGNIDDIINLLKVTYNPSERHKILKELSKYDIMEYINNHENITLQDFYYGYDSSLFKLRLNLG